MRSQFGEMKRWEPESGKQVKAFCWKFESGEYIFRTARCHIVGIYCAVVLAFDRTRFRIGVHLCEDHLNLDADMYIIVWIMTIVEKW